MKVSSILSDLSVLSVSEEQAKLYFHLLQIGPTKASNLLPFMDVSRSKVYRLLDELAEAGFVSKSTDSPIVFSPLAPKEAFDLAQTRLHRRMDRLDTIRARQLDRLQNLRTGNGEAKGSFAWQRIEGMPSIYRFLQTKIEAAESSIEVVSNQASCFATDLPVVEEIWQASFQHAIEADLDYKLLLDFPGDPKDHVPSSVEISENVTFRSFTAQQTVHFVLLDRSKVLMWTQPAGNPTNGAGRGRDDVAVWTSAPGSVASHEMLFETLWAQGEPVLLGPDSSAQTSGGRNGRVNGRAGT